MRARKVYITAMNGGLQPCDGCLSNPTGSGHNQIEARKPPEKPALVGGPGQGVEMEMRPAAFVAAAALIASAAGIGAYFAVRDNTELGGGADSDARMAMATTGGIALPVDATEQVVELAEPEPEPAAAEPEAPPAPRVAEQPAPSPPPAPPPAPAPEPQPEPAATEAPDPPAVEPTTSRDVSVEAGAAANDLPEIDGWRRAERPADAPSPDVIGAEPVVTGPAPVTTDADGWPVTRTAETAVETARTADADVDHAGTSTLPAPPAAEEIVLDADSVIGLQIDSYVSSDSAEVEDDVQARVTRDVIERDRVLIPAGTVVMGSVVLVEQAGQFRGRTRLGVRFHTVVFDDGVETPIMTETVYREGEAQGKQNAAKVGGGAIAGAILGAIFGGGRGAAIGGAAGASAGTAAAAAGDGEPATLVAGTTLTVRLSRPATIAAEP